MLEFLSNRVVITIAFFLLAYGLKVAVANHLKKRALKKDIDNRYLINNTKNVINLSLIVVVIAIWTPEIQSFALSVAAFIVAIVLATKEIIQCFIGFIYLSSTNLFRVGDWVKFGDTVGEVTASDWAKVTLLEVDMNTYEYTGRTVFVPNNQLMTQIVRNMNYMRRYVSHSFSVVTDVLDINPLECQKTLLSKAKLYCEEFSDVAERYNSLIEKRLDVKISGPEPSVKLSTSDLGKYKLTVNYFCPTHVAKTLEERLTADFFEKLFELKSELPVKEQAEPV